MNRQQAEDFIKTHKSAVLATIGKDGRPQTSNVLTTFHEGGLLLSTTENTAKYRNLQRDPRVTVHVLGDNFWQWLAVEGTVTFTHMPDALPRLRTYYESATGGPHSNWAEYDEAMEKERRVLGTISIDRMYPLEG
jgi:PPOX class probable F420-dependent enzyme